MMNGGGKVVFFKKSKKADNEVEQSLDFDRIPAHIAVIMDGNGRWAKRQNLPRVAGHQRGMEVVKTMTKTASNLGVKVLTLYAFSTENWKRPEAEVGFLMKLPGKFFDTFVPELVANNVKVMVMGYVDQLPEDTQRAVNDAIAATADNTGMILNFALNYGGRAELTSAVRDIATKVRAGEILPDEIDDAVIDRSLMTAPLGELRDPDMLLRTSGEMRLSNFMLWQLAYAEFVFVNEHWPEMTPDVFKRAIATYQSRDRRFGGIAENQSDEK
jgi:undecaprenyl diphosphate synthase